MPVKMDLDRAARLFKVEYMVDKGVGSVGQAERGVCSGRRIWRWGRG